MSSPPEALRVEARLELTEADFRYALASMPERRFGGASASAFAALVVIAMGTMQGFDAAIWLTLAFVVVLLVFANRTSTRLQARRFFNEIDPGRRSTSYVFTPSSVEITTKNSHARQDYEALQRYVLTPHTLLLYSSNSIAQIIPLRAFAPDDRERVVAWVKAGVKPSPRLPSALLRTLVVWLGLLGVFMALWWLFAR
ncbi:MAG TPA: YcxB family protein [Polyangiaceae bacterium]